MWDVSSRGQLERAVDSEDRKDFSPQLPIAV